MNFEDLVDAGTVIKDGDEWVDLNESKKLKKAPLTREEKMERIKFFKAFMNQEEGDVNGQ